MTESVYIERPVNVPDPEAAGMLHDFNNALQGIAASVRLLERRIARQDKRDIPALFEAIHQQLARLAPLGPAIIAEFGAAAMPAQPDLIAVGPFLRAMAPQVEALLHAGVAFDLTTETDAGQVVCDQALLEGAIRNLVLNARDAMDGGGTLRIQARRAPAKDGAGSGDGNMWQKVFAEIKVSDTGRGMTPEMLRRCFEPFVSSKQAAGGSGLGLYQVRNFAEGAGGTVQLQSQEKLGTEVVLLLPDVALPLP